MQNGYLGQNGHRVGLLVQLTKINKELGNVKNRMYQVLW